MTGKKLPKFLRGTLVFYAMASLISMAPMNLSFLLVLVSWFAALFSSSRTLITQYPLSPEFKSYRYWGLALLFTCWGSLVVTKFFPYAYAGHDPEVTLHGLLKIWYLLIPAVLATAFEIAIEAGSDCENFSLVTMIKPWWWVTIALCIVAIIQYFTGWPEAEQIPDSVARFHANLFFGHHLSTSSILIFPTFTALAIALGAMSRKKYSSLISTRFALIVGVAGLIILFLSYARTAWLALVIGIFLLIKKYLVPHLTRKQWIIGSLLVILSAGAASQLPIINARIQSLYGINERTRLWKANIDFFTHRPLTGIGWLKTQEMSEFYFKQIDPENYKGYFWGHAHSNFFEMLGGTGLLGLLAFLGWSFFTLRLAHRLTTRFELRALSSGNLNQNRDFFYSDFSRGLFVALILLHFNGLTNVTFWEGKVMHQQMLAVGMLLILDRVFERKKASVTNL